MDNSAALNVLLVKIWTFDITIHTLMSTGGLYMIAMFDTVEPLLTLLAWDPVYTEIKFKNSL